MRECGKVWQRSDLIVGGQAGACGGRGAEGAERRPPKAAVAERPERRSPEHAPRPPTISLQRSEKLQATQETTYNQPFPATKGSPFWGSKIRKKIFALFCVINVYFNIKNTIKVILN